MHDYDKPIDYHNTIELRSLLDQYSNLVDRLNDKLLSLNNIEKEIIILIAKNDDKFKTNSSYEQKLIKLIAIDEKNSEIVSKYHDTSTDIKILNHQKSLVEEQIKCEKKIFDSTPK